VWQESQTAPQKQASAKVAKRSALQLVRASPRCTPSQNNTDQQPHQHCHSHSVQDDSECESNSPLDRGRMIEERDYIWACLFLFVSLSGPPQAKWHAAGNRPGRVGEFLGILVADMVGSQTDLLDPVAEWQYCSQLLGTSIGNLVRVKPHAADHWGRRQCLC